MNATLTPAQARYLAEIREAGAEGRKYNGRARKVLDALEALGLIVVDYDLVLHYGGTLSGLYQCWSVEGHETTIVANGPAGKHGPVGGFTITCSCGQFEFVGAQRWDVVNLAVHHLFKSFNTTTKESL
jgi:hypothetical protein